MRRRAFLGGLGAAGCLTLAGRLEAAAPRARIVDKLRDAKVEILSRVTVSAGAADETLEVTLAGTGSGTRNGRYGGLTFIAAPGGARPDAVELVSTARVGTRAAATAQQIGLTFSAWSRDNYVVLPGACYAGNRFQSRGPGVYPPLLTEPADIGPNVPTIVPDIPRLAAGDGPSSLVVDATELATPAVALLLPASRLGIIMLVEPTTTAGAMEFSVRESDDRTRAFVTVGPRAARAVGVRAPGVKTGAAVPPRALSVRLHAFDCADVTALFERLFALRKDVTGPLRLVHELPFSAAFVAHEARVNARWVDKPGYFAAGARDSAYSTWQTGWCGGGLMATLPLLLTGSSQSRMRAKETIAFALEGQAPSGFFHAISDGKTWFDDGFSAPLPPPAPDGARARPAPVYKQAKRWHLVRRSADALTLLAKQIMLAERPALGGSPATAPAAWTKAVRHAADALVRLWERYHQLGQFVDVDTGQLVVGGSTSAALAPAGLTLAAACCKEPRYLQTAKAIGEHYYNRFVRIGLTCGGPGDALQAPDSQSAAALLESFVTLADATGEPVWIDRARAAAHLLASWVVSYEPRGGGTGCSDNGAPVAGSVVMNANSRARAPGHVLASGEALLRLYRATGDVALLELLRDTIHNLARHLRASEDPDCRRPDGRASVVPMDGVFDSIGLLSYAEVPSIYVRPDTGFVFVFDHLTVRLTGRAARSLTLAITNPTRSDAVVRVLSESAEQASKPLLPPWLLPSRDVAVAVPAGATISFEPDRPGPS